RIRVIGVDTPESVDPNRPDEPYGKEASDFAKHYLDGETAPLAGDAEPRDRYGRMLAYVWLRDGTFWNALLVAEGYAQQLTIPPNVTYAVLFRRLAREARQHDRGLWAEENRGGSGGGRREAPGREGSGTKGRPAVRGVPVVPQPPVHTPDGAAVARRTCFPRLPSPLGLVRTAQAGPRAEVPRLERPPAPSWTSSVFAYPA